MEEAIKILLVEDNSADADLIEIYLKEAYGAHYKLSRAEDLSDGLYLLQRNEYDIILSDLSLPDSSGIETFKEVQAAASEKPVIVLTGVEDELVGVNTVKLGAQDFLIKGKLSAKILQRSINYSIERSKLLKRLSENAKMLEEKTADLQVEKHKLAHAQKLAKIGNWEWVVKEQIFTCSDELYSILGLRKEDEEISYEEFLDFVHPAERDYVRRSISDSVDSQRPFDFFYRIIRRDGNVRTLHSRGELFSDDNGDLVRIIGTVQDFTERKNEEQLEQLAMVATKSYNAVTIADKNGKIEWINEGFTRFFGYQLEDVKGTSGEILTRGEKTGLSPDKEYLEILQRDKKPVTYENKNYSKDGREYWVLTSLTPILNEKGELEKIISIDSDITRQKNAEQKLIVANELAEKSVEKSNRALEELYKAKYELENSMKVKEEFLANMSHEIRTPMNAIIGFTNLLLKGEHTQEHNQYLNAIKTSGENLLVIINDILDFSKLESGKILFENIDFNLFQLISTLVELMLPKTIEKNIKLSASVDKKIPGYLVGDPTRLNQILINLVGNAVKFTEQGGVKISVTIESEEEESIRLRFAVTDTGIGIKQENLSRIFESFTQASSETTRKFGGTGLGLTITKQLVEKQGGAIEVESELNKGSRFSFVLEFGKSAKRAEESFLRKEVVTDEFPLEDVRILLVEDNFLNQVLATKILNNWKCKVETASNGVIAIEKAEREDFDVILMDIHLPEMDGYEATTHIRNKIAAPRCNVPIIAMTAHAFADEADKCIRLGMNDYISKPFDENRLYAKICKALSKTSPDQDPKSDLVETGSKKVTSLSYLEKVANGDKNFILKMISVFINQTPPLIEEMINDLQNKNWKSLRATAHKIKPSVAFMGISRLEEIISDIEEYAGTETSLEKLPGLLSSTEKICASAVKELEAEKEKMKKLILQ